ncbi:MAG TPA: PPXXXP-CTERM sorting domain-containing protein, partial [Actinobacteria bacterium]|nr:PPXXXP-CTERM sorting domain-containing protein [Actinomycetota bacterium]
DAADSDIDAGGVMAWTSLESGEHDQGWDAGLSRPASIGGLVWEDLGANGVQDPGEVGIGEVTVRLFNGAGIEVRSTVTDAAGEYVFTGLTPGSYHVEVDIPDARVASPQDEGADDEVDSDIDADGVMAATTLAPGVDDRRWDAGLHPGDP